jgi:hypothetical protein
MSPADGFSTLARRGLRTAGSKNWLQLGRLSLTRAGGGGAVAQVEDPYVTAAALTRFGGGGRPGPALALLVASPWQIGDRRKQPC